MSDLISRGQVIEAISKLPVLVDNLGYTWMIAGDVLKQIDDIPSAEQEQRWIPVTEALPEEEKEVLVSMHFDGYKDEYINYPPSDYVEIASHMDGVWSSIYDDFKTMRRHHHIVAWMEEPKPYRGE